MIWFNPCRFVQPKRGLSKRVKVLDSQRGVTKATTDLEQWRSLYLPVPLEINLTFFTLSLSCGLTQRYRGWRWNWWCWWCPSTSFLWFWQSPERRIWDANHQRKINITHQYLYHPPSTRFGCVDLCAIGCWNVLWFGCFGCCDILTLNTWISGAWENWRDRQTLV